MTKEKTPKSGDALLPHFLQLRFKGPGLVDGEADGLSAPGCQVGVEAGLDAGFLDVLDEVALPAQPLTGELGVLGGQSPPQLVAVGRQTAAVAGTTLGWSPPSVIT